MLNINTIGTIVLAALTLVELLISFLHRDGNRLKDMLANICLGSLVILTGFFMKALALTVYSIVYSAAIIKPENSALLWVIAFFLCDLVLYIYHLLGHKTRLLWAAHVAHHSSLHYNLSVGFRINFIHLFYRFIFWAPLCLMGITPEMILFLESLTAIWNFLIHTEKIKKLGFLDLVFNTPSNHRVHHASNPEYIDKNLGGILVIYDRLFGTYVKETIPPVYGITHNIYSHNPKDVLLHEYKSVFSEVSKTKGLINKISFLFSKPGTPTTHLKMDDSNKLEQQATIFYSPLNKAI
ncbi:MAG TPA: sterol desaturase family protein [Chitinophagaceae bacterium]|jgi:sterol desaturase/sphingolipid hydroxylase (fatty acid hydroxylase superfamily)|nr:sterol desaturase family protein [Chitinophagaceae bacterium]